MRPLALGDAGFRFDPARAEPVAGPGEALVRVTAAGICGTDLKIFTGGMPASYPVIMGHEISGDVSGERVVVDPVLSWGTCVECEAGRPNLGAARGVIGRAGTSSETYYLARYSATSARWELWKLVNSSSTTLGTYSQTLTAGSTYRVRLEMSGTTIRLYVDGVQQISVTDSSISSERAGRG